MARKFKPNDSSFVIDEGPQYSVIARIVNLGLQPAFEVNEQPKWEYAILLEFPLYKREGGEEAGKSRGMWIRARATLHEKSTLGKIAAAAGIVIDPSQEFDPERLVGANVTVLIKQIEKNGHIYANAVDYTKLARGVTPVRPTLTAEPLPEFLSTRERARLDTQGPAPITQELDNPVSLF